MTFTASRVFVAVKSSERRSNRSIYGIERDWTTGPRVQKRFLSDTHASLSPPAVNLVANWQRKRSVEWQTETDTGSYNRIPTGETGKGGEGRKMEINEQRGQANRPIGDLSFRNAGFRTALYIYVPHHASHFPSRHCTRFLYPVGPTIGQTNLTETIQLLDIRHGSLRSRNSTTFFWEPVQFERKSTCW